MVNLYLKRKLTGFTIVELIVVIVSIAILATIVVVVYNKVMNDSVEASLTSDLSSANITLQTDKTHNGVYPADAASAGGGKGLKKSGDNVLTYTVTSYGFCVSVTNAQINKTLILKSLNEEITEGTCDTVVSTFAGSVSGHLDGTGTAARFAAPYDAVYDKGTGNVFVVAGNYIRKIDANGVVSTLAGGSTASWVDSNIGTNARFSAPSSIAMSSNGDLYVADTNNHRIRKITQQGAVSTVAGSGTAGFLNANGTAARFSSPAAVAVDSAGVIYVADTNNHRIRKIATNGDVTTLAGAGTSGFLDGAGATARFSSPGGIAVNSTGEVYVSDTWNQRIRKVSATGDVTTVAGSTFGYAEGSGATARFGYPYNIRIDNKGAIYVADAGNNRIRKVTPAGVVSTVAGVTASGNTDGPVASARLSGPIGVAVDDKGFLFVADTNNYRIRKVAL